ncbi:uncharacterized protein NEMAJ01_0907 [Nematocida major]|uniref:uncharacterized protein n=1 Tax=Nematocida major TaxID=1912982 RepID=UPI002008D6D3|nr:uncharacterized protein NEMAJ01_0907 [Nematocida major]KAH9386011.1 hypothetical protein NEMAJ01_0907 [Nematocida major]
MNTKKISKRTYVVLLASGVLAILGAVGGYLFFSSSSGKKCVAPSPLQKINVANPAAAQNPKPQAASTPSPDPIAPAHASMPNKSAPRDVLARNLIQNAASTLKNNLFLEFLLKLGEGIEIKYRALQEIANNPNDYKYLRKISDWSDALVQQTLRFIAENASVPEYKSHNPAESVALSNRLSVKKERILHSLGEYTDDTKRVDELAKHQIYLNKGKDSVVASILFIFSIPEIFADLVNLKLESIHIRKKECLKAHSKNLVSKWLYSHDGVYLESPLVFFDTLERLSIFAKAIKHCQDPAEMAKEQEEVHTHIFETIKNHMRSNCKNAGSSAMYTGEDAKTCCMFLHYIMCTFYSIFPHITEGVRITGKGLLSSSESYVSTFIIDGDSRALYVCTSTEQTCKPEKQSNRHDLTHINLQHIYYVDNEKQSRELVIVPVPIGGTPFTDIARYISDMYGKPLERIHLFSFNTRTHGMTYMPMDGHISRNSIHSYVEVPVFYYIEHQNPSDSENIWLVEFIVESKDNPGLNYDVAHLPLFVNDLLLCSIGLSKYKPVPQAAPARPIKDICMMMNERPQVYAVNLENAHALQGYYPLTMINIDTPSDSSIMDLRIVSSSVLTAPLLDELNERTILKVTYRIRKARKDQYSIFPVFYDSDNMKNLYLNHDMYGNELKAFIASKKGAPNHLVYISSNSTDQLKLREVMISSLKLYNQKLEKNKISSFMSPNVTHIHYAITHPLRYIQRAQMGLHGDLLSYLTMQ